MKVSTPDLITLEPQETGIGVLSIILAFASELSDRHH